MPQYETTSTLGGGAQQAREAQVNGSLLCLSRSMESLNGAIETLTQRMSAVLAPCPPSTEGKNPNQIRPARAPLAESVDRLDEQAQRMAAMVTDLLARLEV